MQNTSKEDRRRWSSTARYACLPRQSALQAVPLENGARNTDVRKDVDPRGDLPKAVVLSTVVQRGLALRAVLRSTFVSPPL